VSDPDRLNRPPCDVVVSIINFRTRDLTLACIRSVLDDLAGLDGATGEVIVVDNRSDDGSAEAIEDWIAAQSPPVPVRLVRSATNSGFSGGHNQAIAAQRAAFYLLMNSDGLLRPGALGALLAAGRATPAAGLFAPRIEHEDGEVQQSCFGLPNPASELIRGAASGPVTRLLRRFDTALPLPPPPDRIGWASFACILLSGRMIDALGPLDEGYFLYFEDVEYCLRARRAGWRLLHVPDARMVHFRGGSGPVKKLAGERRRLPAYFYASRSRFFHQAWGWPGLLAANLGWMLGRGIAALRPLTGRPRPPGTAGEARDIWTNFLTPLGDRRAPEGS
jgi:GT2 family glycosyltransferase